MIGKIDPNQFPLEPGSTPGQPNNAGAVPDADADVSVQVNYAFLIEKALQQPEEDEQLVERAKDLLLSGELESQVNFRQAAENIVTFGV